MKSNEEIVEGVLSTFQTENDYHYSIEEALDSGLVTASDIRSFMTQAVIDARKEFKEAAQRKALDAEELAWAEIGNDARHGIGYGQIHRWVTRGVRAGIKAATQRRNAEESS